MGKTQPRIVWTLTLLLIFIGLLAVARRTYVLLGPPQAPRLGAGAAMDAGFAFHPGLTLLHILPGALFFLLAPLQFLPVLRRRYPRWHRWSGRLLLGVGSVVGVTALVMSYKTPIGGANETAATTLFAILFLTFLGLGFRQARQRRFAAHRRWMLRAFGVSLGIATTRPIVGAFFAARQLTPHEFFGTAFWLGFSLTLIATESYVQATDD